MNNFLAFVYRRYYPEGGMNDFIGDYNTKSEARAAVIAELQKRYNDYSLPDETFNEWLEDSAIGHVYDSWSQEIVWKIPDIEIIDINNL